jgi:undecaprenyl-diphosphatase
VFDVIFSWITSKLFWIPLYLVLFFITALKYKWKTVYIGLFLGLLFLIGDRTSVILFKDVFERLRPCHNPEIAELVHIINGKCGGQFGFVSSHATNSFALAIFTGFLLKKYYKYTMVAMLIWAAVVSYSRVYVGVHYPADILCGAILGSIVGYVVFKLMQFTNKRYNLKIGV